MAFLKASRDFRDISKGIHFVGSVWIWLLFFALLIISVTIVASASSSEIYDYLKYERGMHPLVKHGVTIFAGLVCAWAIGQLPPRWLRFGGLYLYTLGVILMICALPFVGVTLNGATRWIHVLGFSLQPSEFFKVALIAWGAVVGAKARREPERAVRLFWTYWLASAVVILFFAKDNGSTGAIMFLFLAVYSVILGAPWRHILYILVASVLAGVLGLTLLFTLPNSVLAGMGRAMTIKNRLTSMTAEESFTIRDDNRQEQYAKIALANSELVGKGPGRSKLKEILPMADSDFVYAIIIEEYGVLGMIFVPALYVGWFVLAAYLAQREKNLYRRYLLYGIGFFFPMQALVNMAVVADVFMTGQPLPLISKGGSSMIVGGIVFGIMASISNVQRAVARLEQEAKSQGVELEPSELSINQ